MRNALLIAAGLLLISASASAQDGTACLSDDECAAGEYCALPDCGEDADCSGEGVCLPDGSGAPMEPECTSDADCPDGSMCVEECWEAEDGTSGCLTYCEPTGEPTEPVISECESDADCADGESCLVACYDCDPDDMDCESACFGECIGDDPLYGECLTDADCGAGQSCVAIGTSTCAAEPCPDGEACDPMPCEDETIYMCMDDPEPECTTDADCGPGFACEVIGSTGTAWACSSDDPDCEPGFVEEEVFYGCVPAQCASDADCPAGLECMEFGWTACPDIACAPGEDCPDVECEEVVEAYCAPAYIGPCEVDADCGEGFTCEASEICTCSGSTGAPTPDGYPDAEDPMEYPTEEECTCEPGELYCAPVETECWSDADCPADWTCELYDVAVPEPIDPTDPGADEDPAEYVESGLCVPPYGDYWTPNRDGGGYSEVTAEAVGEEDEDLQVSVNPEPTDATRPLADDGGCQVAPTRAPLGALLGGLLGLVAIRRRRRG